MEKKGIKCWSEKEKRIIKTLMAFIILGNLSYAENLESGVHKNDVVLGKNDGKGTMYSKGDGGTYKYDFKGNVTIDGSKIDDNTPIISNKGKDNINISLEKDKTMTIYSGNKNEEEFGRGSGEVIKATSENKDNRKSININDKDNKNGNLVFEYQTDKIYGGGSTILAENADINIFAENYKSSSRNGIEAKKNGKVNIDLSGNFESETSAYNDQLIDAENSEVNISANSITLSAN